MINVKFLGALAVVAIAVGGIAFLPRSQGKSQKYQIEAVGLAQYGVEIVDRNHPEFDRIMAQQKTGRVSPYSVFVVNNASQGIASCTLKWEILLPDGRITGTFYTRTGRLETVPDASPARLEDGIPVKGSLLFSPVQSSGPDGQARTGVGFSMGGGGPDVRALLSNSVKVTVSIDGVLFCDGTYVGPDASNNIEFLRGQIEANRDLASEIDRLIGEGKKLDAIMRRLQKVTNAQQNEVQRPPGEVPEYSFGKWMQRGTFALTLLMIREKKGDDAMLERVRAELSKPQIELKRLELEK